ncbi:unnamed protein product, partial [Ixodes pacificus]
MAWVVLDPSEVSRVKQLMKLVRRRRLLVGKHRLYLDDAWLPPVECLRVLRNNDVMSVVWGERDSKKISSAPNGVVQNGGVKRHLEQPDLLPQRKRRRNLGTSRSVQKKSKTALDIIEYQAAGTSITAEAAAEASAEATQQPATLAKPRLRTSDLQTTQNNSSCNDSEAVFSSFVTPDRPKKKWPRKPKKKPKVPVSIEPSVNLTPVVFDPLKISVEPKGNHMRFEHESHWDEIKADGAEQKEADERGQGEADDGMQGGAENGGQDVVNEDEVFAPDDCFTPVLQKMLMDKSDQTPPSLEKSLEVCKLQSSGLVRAVKAGRGGADFRASTARPYADFPKLKTPSRVGDAIAFKVLELDANYCPNASGYKKGEIRHHS